MAVNRYYSNTATATTLGTGVNGSVTTITVGSVTGHPVTFPYTLILDEGETSEEVVTVTSASGLDLTVTRGSDGTAGVPHSSGATVIHGTSARDYREPQEHIAANTGVHGMTGAVVGTTDTQTLSNKTLTAPALTGVTTGASVSCTGTVSAASVSATTAFRFGLTGNEVQIQPESNAIVSFLNPGASLWATIKAAGVAPQSSLRYKERVRETRYRLRDVLRLRPVDYVYKAAPETPQTGLIAEEVAQVFPESVVYDTKGRPDAIDYAKFVPVLIRAIQELAERLERLEA